MARPPNVEKYRKKKNVKGLIKALEYGDDAHVRRDAVQALGECGDARAVEPLTVRLRDADLSVRLDAAKVLGDFGDPRAVNALLKTLRDPGKPQLREAAAQALGALGDTSALTLERLIERLRDFVPDVRAAAAEALERLQWQPENDDERVRRALAVGDWQEIGDLGSAAVKPLTAALGTLDEPTERRVRQKLRRFGDAGVAPLIAALASPHNSMVVGDLMRLGDAAVEPLIAALGSDERNVRQGASAALTGLGWRPKNQFQRAQLAIADEDRDELLGTDWRKLKDRGAAVDLLIGVLRKNELHWELREEAADALGKLGDARALEPLTTALNDDSGPLVSKAAEALGDLGDARAVEPLTAALWDNPVLTRVGPREGHLDQFDALTAALTKLGEHETVQRALAARERP